MYVSARVLDNCSVFPSATSAIKPPAPADSSIASAPVPAEESKRDALNAPACEIVKSCASAVDVFVIANVGADKPAAGYASISIPPLVASEAPALITIASTPVPAELRARDASNAPICSIVKSSPLALDVCDIVPAISLLNITFFPAACIILISPAEALSPIASVPVPVEESNREPSNAPACSIVRSCP